jgi:hypothetical protein
MSVPLLIVTTKVLWMSDLTRLLPVASIAALTVLLGACGGGGGRALPKAPETATGAGAILQAAGVFEGGPFHVVNEKQLQGAAASGATYTGIVSNSFSPLGDAPVVYQFKTVSGARAAFVGPSPALAVSASDFAFRCGALVIVGDTQAKVSSARSALGKRFKDCDSVGQTP